MRFEFATANRIVFGPGTLREAGAAAREFGRRALVVTGRAGRHSEQLLDLLAAEGVAATVFAIAGEPTIDGVIAATGAARAIAAISSSAWAAGVPSTRPRPSPPADQSGDPLDYLEVVGRGLPLTKPAAPCITIPTTAGTGAEVTRNAVLTSPDRQVKVSLRSPLLLPAWRSSTLN